MAGIIGIYGLVVSVLISDGLKQKQPLFTSFIQLGAGLSVGLSGLAAGFAIGIVGDAGVRGTAQQPRLFVGMILILIFAEVLGKLIRSLFQGFSLSRLLERRTLTLVERSLWSHCRVVDERQGRLFDRVRIGSTCGVLSSQEMDGCFEASGSGGFGWERGSWKHP